MINIPINKILFLDIETVGLCRNWEGCKENHPNIAEQFVKYFDWFLKRFPEDNVETDGLEGLFGILEDSFLIKTTSGIV